MEFSEQEENALNAPEESESVGPDSAEVESELTAADPDSATGDEVKLESEVFPAENESPESDLDSPAESGEEVDLDMSSEDIHEDADSEEAMTETDSPDEQPAEKGESAESTPPEAEVESTGEQIVEAGVEEPLADDGFAEEQEQDELEILAESASSEVEIPASELETAGEQIAEPEIDESLIEEGAAALAAELTTEAPVPALEPESSIAEDDSSDVSLDFLDQDQTEMEEEDGRAWFVVHCYSGYENKVRHNLEQRIETMGMKDKIFDIVVPTEEEIEVREGKRRTVERRVFPGYILVNMVMTEESWYVVRNTPGVTGFVGMGNTPTPLRPEEVSQIIKRMEAEAPRIKVTFKAGERVRIVDGPFNDFRGTVSEIDMERAKVRVMVNFFGRETPVELDFLQVEKT